MQLSVKIYIDNVYSKIVGFLPDEIHKEIDKTLSYRLANSQHIKIVKEGKWDGIIRLYRKHDGQSFYTGLLAFVREILEKNNVQFEKIDRKIRPEQNFPELKFINPKSYEEREYQDITIQRALKFTRGILKVCTGGGKTLIVTKLISEIKTYPFMFYVLTKDLMEQAHDVLSSSLNCEIGMIGDGRSIIKRINVCTIQTAINALYFNRKFKISDYKFDKDDKWDEKGIENIEKAEQIKKLIESAKGVYADEAHHVGSRTVKDVLSASKNAYWRYGGSATPYREDNADILIQAMFGSKIVDISASYLIQKKYLVKPYIFFVPIDYISKYKSYMEVYKDAVTQNESFHQHVAKTTNHIISRGLSTLILVKFIEHGKALQKLIPNSQLLISDVILKKRKEILQEFREKKSMCLIATSLADEGLDVPTLDVAILAGGGASATKVNQRIGRTLRIDKNSPNPRQISSVIIYDFFNTKYIDDHIKKIKKILRTEKEFVVSYSKGIDHINEEVDGVFGFTKSV